MYGYHQGYEFNSYRIFTILIGSFYKRIASSCEQKAHRGQQLPDSGSYHNTCKMPRAIEPGKYQIWEPANITAAINYVNAPRLLPPAMQRQISSLINCNHLLNNKPLETLFAGVRIPLLPLTFLFSAFRYYRRPVVPSLSYLSLYTLRFLSAYKSLLPLHLKHLLYSPPIRKKPPLSQLPLRRVLLPLRFLRHLTLHCAAEKTSRYHITFRFFSLKPHPLLNTPTAHLIPTFHTRCSAALHKNSSVAISNRLEQADHITLQRYVAGTEARSRLTILGVLLMRQPGCYIRELITSTALIRSWETTPGTAAHSFLGVHHGYSSHSFLGDHYRKLSVPQRPTTLRNSQVRKLPCAREIQAPLRLSRLERTKRNLSTCAREIRAPLSPRPLEQSKRNLSHCGREIQAPLRLSPQEQFKRNLSPCAREIQATLSLSLLEQSKRNLSPFARAIRASLSLVPAKETQAQP
ncbi:hypothetical protein J6590_014510 [Homalodisca vitripennis]|nr:hypothetical protein J6590_014510 [Homalodisca vitripennis]